MKYSFFVSPEQAKFIQKKLGDKAIIKANPYWDLVQIEITFEESIDPLLLFFAGVDYGIEEAAEAITA